MDLKGRRLDLSIQKGAKDEKALELKNGKFHFQESEEEKDPKAKWVHLVTCFQKRHPLHFGQKKTLWIHLKNGPLFFGDAHSHPLNRQANPKRSEIVDEKSLKFGSHILL